MLRLSSSNAADESEGEVAVATWDAYGPSDMAVVPTEGCIDDGPKPEESQRRYMETGHKELEKLTHENYEQSH